MVLLLIFVVCLMLMIVKIPKFKGRTTSRGERSEENMKRAVQDVLDRVMSKRVATKRYEVPRTSLQDPVKAVKQGQKVIFKPILGCFQQTFTPEYERQLCQHVIDLNNRLMPLTRNEFLRLTYDLAEKVISIISLIRKRGWLGKILFWLSRREIQIWR